MNPENPASEPPEPGPLQGASEAAAPATTVPARIPDGHPGLRDKKKGQAKTRILLRSEPAPGVARKPDWIRVKLAADPSRFLRVKAILREQKLHTVCEEASCPNIGECFGHGTATFMIMGDKCTRRCPFCDVGHGYPDPLDEQEPARLAETVAALGLSHVVITSVDRDDLKDGGAAHFARCIRAVREASPATRIEVLVPDFRGRMDEALEALCAQPPDIFNHNLETVPRLYRQARPGANYEHSLALLREFGARMPAVPTKSGLMLGLGETDDEILQVMRDLRAHQVSMLTIGQYLAPSGAHLPVLRYAEPAVFERLALEAREMGFEQVASAPLVRSSYHAESQARGEFA